MLTRNALECQVVRNSRRECSISFSLIQMKKPSRQRIVQQTQYTQEFFLLISFVIAVLTDARLTLHPRLICSVELLCFYIILILDRDASSAAIVGVLSPIQRYRREQPICYCSRSLSNAERKCCETWKDVWVVIVFSRLFMVYLFGRQFILRTGHQLFWWLFNCKDPLYRLAKWQE